MVNALLALALLAGPGFSQEKAEDQLKNVEKSADFDAAPKREPLSERAKPAEKDVESKPVPEAAQKKPLTTKAPPDPVEVKRIEGAENRGLGLGLAIGALAGAASAAPILWFALAKDTDPGLKTLGIIGALALFALGLYIGQDAGRAISKENEKAAIDEEKAAKEPKKDPFADFNEAFPEK